MADDKIKAYDRHGEKITIDRSEIGKLYALGGRLASKAEISSSQLEADYEKQSTLQKIGGYAKFAGPVPALVNALTGDGKAAPVLESFREGAFSGATVGVGPGIERQVRDVVQGKPQGEAFAAREQALQEAHGTAYGAGELAGMVGGSLAGGGVGAARAVPAAGVSAVGAAVEHGAGSLATRALGGAAESVAGRAAVAATELGARGAVEGGIYGAGQAVGRALLTDDPSHLAEKIYAEVGHGALYGGAGGALLGGAGSLAASAGRAASGSLAEAMSRGRSAAVEGANETGSAVARVASEVEEATGLGSKLRAATTDEGIRGMAEEQAWRSIGAGHGMQSTGYARRAEKYLPNGTRDVGEVLLRRGVFDSADQGFLRSVVNAGADGTPAKILPKIEAELEVVGQRIGEITSTSPARIEAEAVAAALDGVAKKYEGTAATRPVGRSLRAFGADLLDSMQLTSPGATASVQDALRERKAIDRLVFQDAPTVDPRLMLEARREIRTALEDLITDTLDKNSGKVPGALRDEYKALKKDYTALSIASEAAEDSAARMSKNRIISPSDYAAAVGAAAGGHLMAAPVAAMGHKVLRERGNAMAAVALKRAADLGVVSKWVSKVDDQIGRASKGLLVAPTKGLPKASDRMPPARQLAKSALARVAAFQADPQGHVERATRQVEGIATHRPELADAIVERSVQAMTFLASKVPVAPDPDPLDPHPAPKLTANEEAELARYAWYTEKPVRFFAEVARGKLTYEGAETAQTLMPQAFANLQRQTLEALAVQMARGNRLPFRQRQVLGVLLDMAATPSQYPAHTRFLQGNVEPVEPPPPPAPKPSSGGAGKAHMSALDRLEARGAGR